MKRDPEFYKYFWNTNFCTLINHPLFCFSWSPCTKVTSQLCWVNSVTPWISSGLNATRAPSSPFKSERANWPTRVSDSRYIIINAHQRVSISTAPDMHLGLQFNNATLVRALITFSAFLVSFHWRVINIYRKSGCSQRVTLLNCVLRAEKYTLSLMSKHKNLLCAVISLWKMHICTVLRLLLVIALADSFSEIFWTLFFLWCAFWVFTWWRWLCHS
jgi:hypothetical protein